MSNSTTSFTSPALPTPTARNSTIVSNRVSQNSAVGIGIGSAAGGAILAGLVFFLLFSYKRRKSQGSGHYSQEASYSPDKERNPSPAAKNPAGVSVVESYLPQPAEDGKITGAMSKLRDNIKNHVQSYYHNSAVDPGTVDQSQLQELAAATGISASKLCQLLMDPQSRLATIRLYLSWLIFSRCDGRGAPDLSILPPEVALLAYSISENQSTSAGELALASKYKSISAALLEKKYGQRKDQNDPRERNISQAVTIANSFLSPFILNGSEQRLKNLKGIMQRAAGFAYLLFSQPSSWAFDWHAHMPTKVHQDGIVVFPALIQTTDEAAQLITPPRVFVEAEQTSFSSRKA